LHPILKKCNAILEPLTKATPGLVQGLYYLAKVKFVCGKTEQAKICLDKVLEKDPSHFEANLLMPQVIKFYYCKI
jgi:tetratricopeptide repeat protein 21B